LQPVAISGKSPERGRGENKPKALPPAATSCVRSSMVRRGSTVRVRQRALQNPCLERVFRSCGFARAPACGGYGAVYGAPKSRSPILVSGRRYADLDARERDSSDAAVTFGAVVAKKHGMFRGLFIGIDRYASDAISWLSCAERDASALHSPIVATFEV
jgi:hypothetical protein